MSHANMYYATGPKPSPAYAHTELFNIIKFHFFFLTIFFPIISFDFSSRATFSLCYNWESEQHCPTVHCRAKPWGGSLQKLAPFKIVFNLLYC